jgi:single-strand DNA-binding protein
MNEIISTVLGNVASEPRHVVGENGPPRTSFRLASTTTRFDQGLQGYVDGHTTWLTVTCWRGLAFNVAQSLQKGQPVIVHGTLHVREWTDGDRSGREVELDATSIGHDLRRGRTTFARVTRPVADRTLISGGVPGTDAGGGTAVPGSPDGFGAGPGNDAVDRPGEAPDVPPEEGEGAAA